MKTQSPNNWCKGPVIGQGSTATVSLATDVFSGEVFAVKSGELACSAMLQREQKILSELNSPYVVSYQGYDIGCASMNSSTQFYHLFLEYASKGSVTDEINKCGGQLNESRVRSYTLDIVNGLCYLHSIGIVHCDIKTRNILVYSNDQVKIADFGCAHWKSDGIKGKQIRGTPMFMAPEVARGEEQDFAADVWALGCAIIEMATGGQPWVDVYDPVAALHRIAFSDDVPELPECLSDDGKDFLSKCLKRDPVQRWTAQQLLQHPFVAGFSSDNRKIDAEHNWVSPKSILLEFGWGRVFVRQPFKLFAKSRDKSRFP